MNQAAHRRHDISDKNWNAIKEKLPGATGKVGRPSYDNRLFINKEQKIQAEIAPKRNRRQQRFYDKHLYKHRHLIENAFLHLKRWRSVATRYAKNIHSFLAIIQIRCIDMWLR